MSGLVLARDLRLDHFLELGEAVGAERFGKFIIVAGAEGAASPP